MAQIASGHSGSEASARLTVDATLAFLKQQRPIVRPNQGFVAQLRAWADTCHGAVVCARAPSAVAAADVSGDSLVGQKRKAENDVDPTQAGVATHEQQCNTSV